MQKNHDFTIPPGVSLVSGMNVNTQLIGYEPLQYALFTINPAICVFNKTYFVPYYTTDWFAQKAPQLSEVCVTPPTMPVQGKIGCYDNGTDVPVTFVTNWFDFYSKRNNPKIPNIVFSKTYQHNKCPGDAYSCVLEHGRPMFELQY